MLDPKAELLLWTTHRMVFIDWLLHLPKHMFKYCEGSMHLRSYWTCWKIKTPPYDLKSSREKENIFRILSFKAAHRLLHYSTIYQWHFRSSLPPWLCTPIDVLKIEFIIFRHLKKMQPIAIKLKQKSITPLPSVTLIATPCVTFTRSRLAPYSCKVVVPGRNMQCASRRWEQSKHINVRVLLSVFNAKSIRSWASLACPVDSNSAGCSRLHFFAPKN